MNLADHRRRTLRTRLLLAAILIPTGLVILLVFLVVRQDHELADRRAAEARREALEQLRRELTARLQALRLEEVNRLIGESGTRLPANSPIVFVAPIVDGRMVLPWEQDAIEATPSAEFRQRQQAGEVREFQMQDPRGAAAIYRTALVAAGTDADRCRARLALGRSLFSVGDMADAARVDGDTLRACEAVRDDDGVPIAVYAAARLLDEGRHDEVRAYLAHAVALRRWPAPNEAYLLQMLLRRIAGGTASEPFRRLARTTHEVDQLAALARTMSARGDRLQAAARSAPGDLAWMGYGDDPWLVTLVSPASFAAPVVMAVSARQIAPAGVTLRTLAGPATMALGDGFLDLQAEWPAGRFESVPAVSPAVYATMLATVIGAVLLTGYLLLRDVHRESSMASMRSDFVASVSHELKTPLTSIRAHAETLLLGRASGSAATAEYLETIVSESERLGRLVDSVLEFSRIEQGRKTYHMRATRLDDVVRAAARTLEFPLAQLGFTLLVTGDGTDPVVSGDPEALTQAILNLLSNAMKYSGSARRVEMRIGTRGSEAFVDVVDHGIGIRRDDQSRIFDRFHRVRSAETAAIAGAGLGLALALHAVEAHRGRIAVVSDVGRGSTFSVRIPLQAS